MGEMAEWLASLNSLVRTSLRKRKNKIDCCAGIELANSYVM